MLDPEHRPQFEDRFMVLRLVCGAMAGSVATFSVLAFVLAGKAPPLEHAASLQTVFCFAAAGVIGVSLLLHKRLLGRPRLEKAAGRGLTPLLDGLQQAYIVLFALWETPATMGLVYALLSGSVHSYWPFAAASALGMAYSWPRRQILEERISSIMRGPGGAS